MYYIVQLLYPRNWCGRKTAFVLLLQWRMHQITCIVFCQIWPYFPEIYLILSYVRLRGRLVTYYPPLFTVQNCFSHFRTLVVAVNMAHACAGAPGVIKVDEFLGWQETGRGIFSRDKPDPAPMCLPPELSFRQCEQLLEVAPPVKETKYAIALEVYGRLLNLECDKQIAAAVLWFTGIHTESKEWAAIHL